MHKAIVIGVSAGGLHALSQLIPQLPKNYPLPVMIVQHRLHDADDFLANYLNKQSDIQVKDASLRETIMAGWVYFAPAGYHLLVERDKTFGLSIDQLVNYAIPSIDVLFESAAAVYRKTLIGIILTGANDDGSQGLKTIKEYGGLTIVQDPVSAAVPAMPKAAIATSKIDHIMTLDEIAFFIKKQIHQQED